MSMTANYAGALIPSVGSLLIPYLLLVLVLYVVPPYLARCLCRFEYKQIFAGGIAVFYVVFWALCKAHKQLPGAIYAFYTYARSPFVVLLAVACSGFLVFTVWVFSSRTTSRREAVRTGSAIESAAAAISSDCGVTASEEPRAH